MTQDATRARVGERAVAGRLSVLDRWLPTWIPAAMAVGLVQAG